MKRLGLLLSLLVACGGSGGDPPPDDPPDDELPPATETVEWTILVYGHGDHNLSYSLARDVLEMAEARIGQDVTVLVMADWDGATQGFSTGTEWYAIDGSGAEPRLVATGPELNLDDPAVLAGAIEVAFKANPARRYGLVLWDHGGAWKHGFGSDLQDGTVSHPTPMSLPDIRAGIVAGMNAAGLSGTQLEFLAFDTCLMAGAEIASAMVGVAKILVGNAEIDYGNGWDYEVALSALTTGSTIDFAKAEVTAWNAHHQPPDSTSVPDTLFRTHVAIDLEKWGAFETKLQALVAAWIGSGSGQLTVPRSASDALPGFELSSVGQLGSPPELRDVGQFLTLLAATTADPQVATLAQQAKAALDAAVLARAQGSLRTNQGGVHIQLPPAAEISAEDLAAYRSLAPEWATRSRWADALERVVALRDDVAPAFTTTIANQVNPTPAMLPTLGFTSMDADVSSVGVYLGYVEPANTDLVYMIGLVGTGQVDPGTPGQFVWNGGALTLPGEAGGRQFVSVDLWARSPSLTLLRTPGLLTVMGGAYEAALLLDVSTGEVAGLLVYEPSGNSSVFDLSEVDGAVFTPLLPTYRISTSTSAAVEGTPITLRAASPPSVARASVPTGTAILFTQLEDIWGNQGVRLDGVSIGTPIPQ